MGTVVETYAGYKNVKLIDSGGFGKVYKYTNQKAVKEEFKVCLYVYCVSVVYQFIDGWLS